MNSRLAVVGLAIRRSALGPVFALSGLTVRESVRKKIFLLLAVFTLVMLGATAMLPALRPADRVALVQTWAQRCITFFGVIIAVALAGVSLPEDIEERKIFTLLSKPITRWQLLAGRFVGFTSLLAGFAVAGFLISALFIRVVSHGSGGTLANTTEILPVEFRIEEEAVSGKFPGRVTVQRSGKESLLVNLSGPVEIVAVYYFRGVDVTDLSETVPVRISADVSSSAMQLLYGEFEVFLKPQFQKDLDRDAARALGWKVGFAGTVQEGQPLPPLLAERRITLKAMQPIELQVPRSWFGPEGDLDIAIKRVASDVSVALHPDSIRVISAPHNFEWNFAKAMASTFLLWMVVLSLIIMGSTILSAPVNLLFGIAVFFSGSMIGFLKEALPQVKSKIQDEERAQHAGDEHGHGAPDDIPLPILKASQAISDLVVDIVPDLGSFDASTPILQGKDIPRETLGKSGRYAALYVAIAFLVGLFFFRIREFR